MSITRDCYGCALGDHSKHDGSHQPPGIIGGVYCDCEGDCAERALARFDEVLEAIDLTSNRPAES